jgi:hypothetical protein
VTAILAKASRAAGLLVLLLAVGCGPEVSEPAPPPVPPVNEEPVPPPPVVPVQRSAESEALSQYYARLQQTLLTQGLLRGDGGGPDTPFTDVMLARNFVRIALYDEYAPGGPLVSGEPTLSRLRRWESPVRMEIRFGATVPPDQQARDRATISAYAARLSRITGLPITQSSQGANYHVFVVNEDDRLALEPELRRIAPGIADSSVRAILTMSRSTLCLVVAFSEGGSPIYTRAIAVIRGEHPDLLRSACVHEELAQGLGLANDHPQARPSIFNDDEEFGLLTRHDELLLKILYDERLRPGMTATEAAPVASQIATELMAGPV